MTHEPRPDRVVLDEADWAALRSSALFKSVDPDALARLCGDRHPALFQPRQSIFSQGDRARDFFLILEGWVKVFRLTPWGEEAVVGLFTRGESFAEPAFFLGGVYPASAEAASRLRLLRIDAGRFNTALAEEPGLAAALLGSVVSHTDQLFDEIASLKLLSAPRRLAGFLLRLAPGEAPSASLAHPYELGLPYEKALLAGRLGMTPETLSRAFAQLKKLGVLVRRDRVNISDPPALAAFARGET